MSAFVSIGCSTIDPTGYRLNALFRGVRARCPATSTRCRSVTVANVRIDSPVLLPGAYRCLIDLLPEPRAWEIRWGDASA